METLKCPKCGTVIDVTAGMEAKIKTELEIKYQELATELKENFQTDLNRERGQLKNETQKTIQAAIDKTKQESLEQAEVAKQQLNELYKKLEQARNNELELRKAQRQLEDEKNNLELEVQRKLDEERETIKLKAKQQADDEHHLTDLAKDRKLAEMLSQVEDLKRKAEQGSEQMRGESLELDLENKFKFSYPFDIIEPVGKGIGGADIVQTVCLPNGTVCGKIVWEIKRTKSFAKSWLPKVKDDMRNAKASLCAIITETMPEDTRDCTCLDGVWVISIPLVLTISELLRLSLINANKALEIKSGKVSKANEVYDYLTGGEFKNRVQAIIEAYTVMRNELESEKRSITNTWAKREKQLERVSLQLAGMHGDLAGIVGRELPEVKALLLEE